MQILTTKYWLEVGITVKKFGGRIEGIEWVVHPIGRQTVTNNLDPLEFPGLSY